MRKPLQGKLDVQARITFLVNREGTTIEIRDDSSLAPIATVTLTAEQLSEALSRLSDVRCKAELYPDETWKWGKKHCNEEFVFEIPKGLSDKKKLAEIAESIKPEGVELDEHYSSRGSTFEKDGKYYARTVARSWK